MKHHTKLYNLHTMKLIKIKNDYYLIDDLEIKYKDWYIDDANQLRMCVVSDKDYWEQRKEYKKIISSTFRDAYGQIPTGLDLQEVKELIGEVDVEKKAESRFGTDIDSIRGSKEYDLNTDLKRGFVSGYNQALEDNKEKKYTEEDLQNAWKIGYRVEPIEELTHYFQPKTEWEVEMIDGKLKLL